jgi:DNA mismatch repair protein MutS2
MDTKTLTVLEYPKVLERLAAHCDFSASAALARALEPTDSYDLAIMRQRETSEARLLLSIADAGIGGARDVREAVQLARRGGVLEPAEFLDIKATLISCRELKKSLEKQAESYPRLAELALALPAPLGLVDAITRTISDKSEVLDSASQKLASLRSELRVAHDRLMSRLQKYITDGRTVPMLQDALITQRDGRYVIPLRSEFKGQIKSIVHDQSSSGATLFVEPLAVVELNNKYREVQLAERDEVRRVLAELSTQVGMHAEELLNGVDALAEIDLVFAKAKYAEEIHASEPILHGPKTADRRPKQSDGQPSTVDGLVVIRLDQARHPLLDPARVVPIDVAPAADVRAVVITGPNTGGKTVSLKTVGLMVAMAQSGLHIPARSGSELSIFHDIYADIGDEQSIEQSLSTFSGHITNIIRILKKIDERSLVIFDELGAGTDPQEGAALARAILAHLLERGVTAFVATHYPELKTYAHGTPGVVNASLEFDIATLRPTYKLTIGLPGRSNALAIASRLGLPEEIVSAAKATINPDELRADKLLDDIRKERNRTGREREKIEKSRQRSEALNRDLEKRIANIEDERREVIAKARAEAEMEVEVLMRNIESLKAQLKKARQPLDALKAIEEKVEAVEEKVQAPVARKTVDRPRSTVTGPRSPLALGERVILRTLGSEGVVTALGENDIEVQIGTLRIRAKSGDIQRKVEAEQTADDGPQTVKKQKVVEESSSAVRRPSSLTASPGMELDLRGQRAEDALELLDDYLDRAFLSGMPFVRIIHGKGTGKLRQEVRAVLKDHPHVASFEEGGPKEGGDGVTVATLEK